MRKRWTWETDQEFRALRFARHHQFTLQIQAVEKADRASWEAAVGEGRRLDDELEAYLPDERQRS